MSTLGDAADVNPVIKFLPHMLQHLAVDSNVCGRNLITGLTSAASPTVDISSTCKVGHKIEVLLPLLTCSPLAWPSRLLYHRSRKSWRDLWITLYTLIYQTLLKWCYNICGCHLHYLIDRQSHSVYFHCRRSGVWILQTALKSAERYSLEFIMFTVGGTIIFYCHYS
jgi:hypothetical protein